MADSPTDRFVSFSVEEGAHASRVEFSVVVSNWNGAEWLVRCLSALQLSARSTRLTHEILVVDDASSDDSVALVQSHFPTVRLIRNKRNLGFAESTNKGVRKAKGRVVVLCNNDLVVKTEFLPQLLKWFTPGNEYLGKLGFPDGELFSVSAQTLSWWNGEPNQLCMNAQFNGGRMTPAWSRPKEPQHCVFTQAGAAAYDRIKFLQLRGLRPQFHPGYWEDYDISYRAAKIGWASLYDPAALALHHGGGSMTKRFGAARVARMKARNHLLFEWMNLSSNRLLTRHFVGLCLGLLKEGLPTKKERPLQRAFVEALPFLGSVLRERWRNSVPKFSDQELLKLGKDSKPSF
jgi:GT2 family glycosyltransferase